MEEASREAGMEKAVSQMREEWKDVSFTLVPYGQTGISIVSAADDIQLLLEDHITMTAAMQGSQSTNLRAWGKQLDALSAMVDLLLKVQPVWLYLQPLFASGDFCKQLPTEANMFQQANALWKSIMDVVTQHSGVVINVANQTKMKMQEQLEQAQNMLETVQKGLNDYLQQQRAQFPRFYFLSNADLLDILAKTDNPEHVQPHLRKVFEGINKLRFDPKKGIVGMESIEKEYVEFSHTMKPMHGAVLQLLQQVEQEMRLTIKDRVSKAVASYHSTPRGEWVRNHSGQVVLTASQVHWTAEATEAIRTNGLSAYADKMMKQLQEIVKKIRCELTKNERTTLQALLTIEVHSRDIVLAMEQNGVKSVDEFRWISQLRHYQEQDDVVLRMINTSKQYGYEYLGNTNRLVITPLTDRCYISLMGAIQMGLGGSPQGPAGTGKTETCKDLSKAIGKLCVVFNCSDEIDYKTTGQMFKGIAQSGAWAVFDEFNRIRIEVISTIAQQMQCIQRGILGQQQRITLDGTDIPFNHACVICVTCNPGYAGRTELPDILKAMFRPVAMMVPDYALISEIQLYAKGFLEAKSLATKLVTTFRLASEQLSSQDHYDYGMRAVQAVVRSAGILKRMYPDTDEHVLLLSCLNNGKMPSLVKQDNPLWQGIVSDVFLKVESTRPYYGELETAVRTNTESLNLQPQPAFIQKIMQIYDMMKVRHGLMVVGGTISGKSSAIKILAASLNDLNKHGLMNESKVQMQTINPKSLSCEQLYGSFKPGRGWNSGVLTNTFRDFAASSEDRKWMVFDGPVDAIWIESLNSVLDDNKLLCLANGERINMGQSMTMMFETEDLAVASPATVSRCGMVYMEPVDLGWEPLVKSWMKKELPDILNINQRKTIKALFEWLLPPTLSYVTKCCQQFVGCGEMHLTMSLLKLFKTLLHDLQTIGKAGSHGAADLLRLSEQKVVEDQTRMLTAHFIFSVMWSVGGLLDTHSRTKFDKFIRDLCNGANKPQGLEMAGLPEDGLLYDYVYTHHEAGAWVHWRDLVKPTILTAKPQVHDVIVETVETVRQRYFLQRFVTGRLPVLFIGPTGTGKSLITSSFLRGLPQEEFTVCNMNFSAKTTSDQTHNRIFAQVEKKAGNLYVPPGNKTMCVFVDDLNTPTKECYGAQPPIEVLRQGIDSQLWFSRPTGEKQVLENVFMMAAMGIPGGGLSNVHPRFLRHFNMIGINSFGEETLKSIFTPIVDSHFATGFEATLRPYSKMIVSATTEMYQQSLATFLPTPTKPHYVFNTRDLAKVIQGVLLMDKAPAGTEGGDVVARLWVHEVYRVFYDRLVEPADRSAFFDMVKMTVEVHFSKWFDKLFGHLGEAGKPVRDSDMSGLLFAQHKGTKHMELKDGQLQEDINDKLSNLSLKNEVAFPSFIKHVSHIAGVLNQPKGHCLLIGVSGSGRHSVAHIGNSIAGNQMYQIDVTKTYNMADWKQDMRRMIRLVGESAQPTTFLFGDHQIKDEAFLEDVNMLLKTGYITNLFDANQKLEIIQKMKTIIKGNLSADELYNKFKERVCERLHIVLSFSPAGDAFRKRARMFSALVNCCSIDYFQAWPEDGLEMVAEKYLGEVQMPQDTKVKMAAVCKHLHQSVSVWSDRYKSETGHNTYVTLATYIELLKTFKHLLQEKRAELPLHKYRNGVDKLTDAEKSLESARQTKGDKLEVISAERARWEESLKGASEKFDGVLGDILLAASMVTYLGPYTIDYRQRCLEEWHQLCVQEGINVSEETPSLSEIIGARVEIQKWRAIDLPLDEHSADNAIIATSADRWPLMIDPQGQANKWIRNMEKSNKLEIVKPSDRNYMRIIENCIRFGTPCLLEDVGEELDPVLEPVLARRIFKANGVDCIQLGDHVLDYNKNFKLYMTTQLSQPHYLPEVAVKVNLVNFSVTPLSLAKQLLALVYSKEKPTVTRDINDYILEIDADQKQLAHMEDKMLKALAEIKGSVLDDGPLLQTMSSSQALSEEINEKKEHLAGCLGHRNMIFEHYAPFGRHSAMLYFTITDLASVDPMYQYSLSWFTNLFCNSLEKAEKIKALEPRLKNLTDHFTRSIYQNVCQSLFEKHRLLFSLLLCVGVLRAQNAVDDEEWRFLLTGGIAVQSPIPNPASDWLQDKSWAELVRASKLPALSGLLNHVQNNSEKWKKISDSANPETETYPSPWGDDGRLSMIQRLIILRCLRPDKIVPAVKALVIHYMGASYIEAPTCDLSLSYMASSAATPLIFVLSEAADPMDALTKFADLKGMGSKMATISLGQGQGPKMEQLIRQAAAQGTWVVVQNCHLAPSCMPQLEHICKTVLTDSTTTQPSFRLWLTSYPNKHFPVSILQTGIRMTVEPPSGLKANLLHALQDKVISDPKFFNGSNKPKVFQKLLFGLCYFHALVVERKRFGPIGFNIKYEFSRSDLHHSARQLQMFINEYAEVPLDALQYLAGETNYGGRVTDDKDRRLTISLLRTVYCEAAYKDDAYRFSESGLYYVPPHGNYQNYISYVQSLPDTAKPEAVGLHENAGVLRDQREAQTMFDSILPTLPKQTAGREKIIEDLSADILSKIPADFNIEEAQTKFPVCHEESMNMVLVHELLRYNRLISTIRTSLQQVLKAVKGWIVMTTEIQEVMSAMLVGSVPVMWRRKGYTSVKPLGSFISDLCARLKYFQDWLVSGIPSTFWISGFFFPQAFMTGALQNYSRLTSIPIDRVEFQFEVMTQGSMPAKPESGVYVSGLHMVGARWDRDTKVIAESHLNILYDSMPAIWFKPVDKTKNTQKQTYWCPVYKTSERRGVLSTTGHSTNFVLGVHLPTATPQNHWVNRGVALLCQLDD